MEEEDYMPPGLAESVARYRAQQHHLGWQHVDEILPGLFLSGEHARREIERLNVNVVISLLTAAERDMPEYRSAVPTVVVEHAYVLDDEPDEPLTREMLVDCARKIHAALCIGQRVLVHCARGISRSPAICVAYLLAAGKAQTVDLALALLQRQRPCVCINDGFYATLSKLQDDLYELVNANASM